MLVIRDLKKSYQSFPVLKGLNMTINDGDIYGFIGKNGCGKTTTMNIICDIVEKDDGEVLLGGGKKIRIGYLPETPELYGYMSAKEYLDYIAACCEYDGEIDARTNEVLNLVGLENTGKRRIKGFSRGMNQRLGIGAAIYRNPDLLILDEPTSALDPEGRAEVMEIISKLSKAGTTILLCTHILSDVERVANRIGILSGGVMIEEGTIKDIFSRHITSGPILTVKLNGSDKFNELNEKHIKTLCELPVFDKEVDASHNTVTLYAAEGMTEEQLSSSVISAAAEHKMNIESLNFVTPSLEEIYLLIVEKERSAR